MASKGKKKIPAGKSDQEADCTGPRTKAHRAATQDAKRIVEELK